LLRRGLSAIVVLDMEGPDGAHARGPVSRLFEAFAQQDRGAPSVATTASAAQAADVKAAMDLLANGKKNK